MAGSGTATLDFGAIPGKTDASVAVTGQTGILAGSLVGAWMRPVATADHTADEHRLEPLHIHAGDIVAGTGFTIYGHLQALGGSHKAYGQWTVAWAWT